MAFFAVRGYGLLVPDMLGYAGSSKPHDPSAYVGTKLARDIVDILDHVGLGSRNIAIAHDWYV